MPSPWMWQRIVELGLAEDVGHGDVTTWAIIDEEHQGSLTLRARQPLVAAGMPVLDAAFLVPDIHVEHVVKDGQRVLPGEVLAVIKGRTRHILMAERVVLNVIQRLSGIATTTRDVVDRLAGLPTLVLDTRKTTPGWRDLEKYAVSVGGGRNHRFGLDDMVLIKDNHIAAAGSIRAALDRVHQRVGPLVPIEVEVDRLDQIEEALAGHPHALLLDNMSVKDLRQAVIQVNGRAFIEASGNIRPDNVREVAETGVDAVSLGWLTHSSPSVDIGADWGIGS